MVLIVCLPIFLCMAPWVDATFYDICARVIQRGGVLYRDTFDTNLPGMAWLHLGIRSLFGWRSEVIRFADFLVVAGITYLLTRWDPALPRYGQIWTAVALLAYYFSTTEWCQNQRDVWMLLPCLLSLYLRRWQLLRANSAIATLLLAVLEGLLWGAAVWIKPMAIVPALACWLFSVFYRYRFAPIWQTILLEASGLLMGGLIVGGAGGFWLWRTGAWGPFWDILLNWNLEYQSFFMRWPQRWEHLRLWCVSSMPWCLVHIAALPLALALYFHPALRPGRLATWWTCVTQGSTNELRDRLALTPEQGVVGGTTDWEDLERVAEFLRKQELRENEPICLHESTMPLYLELNKHPAHRFTFFAQATGVYIAHRQQILEELSASRPGFVVSDLQMAGVFRYYAPDEHEAVPELPPHFPKPLDEIFPWSEPIVFCSGRYAVHRVSKPIRKFWQ